MQDYIASVELSNAYRKNHNYSELCIGSTLLLNIHLLCKTVSMDCVELYLIYENEDTLTVGS